jgi:hypothetical protein
MSRYWTWAEIRDKVEDDLDLQDETFVRPDELLAYANEAIDEAEAEVHSLYEDYFLARGTITLVSGQEEYDLPTDIYAHKIRSLVYDNNAKIYKINRVRDWKKAEDYSIQLNYGTGEIYTWFLVNTTPGSPKILLSPPAIESGDVVKIWYIRNANRLVNDTDVCDIPEFVNFIFQYMKVRIYEKEGHPNVAKAIADLEQQRKQMTGTLSSMVPDAENEIEADYSHYQEMS